MKIFEGKVFQPENMTDFRSITRGRQCWIEPYGLKQFWITIKPAELKQMFSHTSAGLMFVREHGKLFCFISPDAVKRLRDEREAQEETAE